MESTDQHIPNVSSSDDASGDTHSVHIPCSKVDLSLVSGIWKTETDDNGKEYHVRYTAVFDPANSSVKRQDSYKL